MSRRRDEPPPSTGPTEAEVLLGFLGYIRLGIVGTVEDAPEPEVRTAMTGSGTNLLGLVKLAPTPTGALRRALREHMLAAWLSW